MENFEATLAIITAIGIGLSGPVATLVEAIKSTDLIPTKFFKLVSLAIGVLTGVVFGLVFSDLGSIGAFAFGGFNAGMAASAIYDTLKNNKTSL